MSAGEPLRAVGAGQASKGVRQPASSGRRRALKTGGRRLRTVLRLFFEHFSALGCAYLGVLPASISERLQAARQAAAQAADQRPAGTPLTSDELAWQAELSR